VLTGGALMVAGQVIFAAMLLAGAAFRSVDALVLLVVSVVLTTSAMLWSGRRDVVSATFSER